MRVKRRLALLVRIGGHDLDQIELIHDQAQHETGEMVVGYEVLHRQRQQQRLIDLPGAKCLAHGQRRNPTRIPSASEIRMLLRQAPSMVLFNVDRSDFAAISEKALSNVSNRKFNYALVPGSLL